MPGPYTEIVMAIHTSPTAAAIVVTGAGSRAIAWLMAEAGASQTVLDAQIPYSRPALDEYVGVRAEQHVSAVEAAAMAEEAFWRGMKLDAESHPGEIGARPVIGLACTATIATDRVKRGEHRSHAAVRTAADLLTASIVFDKGARDRDGEEEIASRLIINLLAEACGVPDRLPVDIGEADALTQGSISVSDPISAVVAGSAEAAAIDINGVIHAAPPEGCAVIAGSFDPVHDGHWRLAEVAADISGKESIFEISVTNVEKPPLDLPVLQARLAQMRRRRRLAVTRAPTFVEKSRLLPGSTFVIGYDTAVRLFDDRFYTAYDADADDAAMGTAWGVALSELRRNGCDFLVAGRASDRGFMTLDNIEVPASFAGMLKQIPESAFRFDGSSSEIRESAG
ncbi:MAG: hypothetical protein IH868_03615 [Chloroflexi bacterium]|nr:hypothetical protein [Chloroflexota bacterium]